MSITEGLPGRLTRQEAMRCGMSIANLASAAGLPYSRVYRFLNGSLDGITHDEELRIRRILILSRDRGYPEPLGVLTITPLDV